MKKMNLINTLFVGVALSCLLPTTSQAETNSEMESLREEVRELKEMLLKQAKQTKSEVKSIQKDIKKIKPSQAFNEGDSRFKLAGYASLGYTEQEMSDGRFDTVQFSPIIQYSYKDKVFFVSELEYKIEADGSTTTALEYATTNVILNDNATLVVGKFLSPLGNFRQNIHPSWINKLASAPVGFGHDQAAPIADVGVQLRGGFDVGNIKTTYAAYMANGPELELNGAGDEIEAIESAGFTRDVDGEKVYGGRITILPFDNFEWGVSGAYGAVGLANESDRSYRAFGSDFSYKWKNLDLRGELIKQHVGALDSSVAPEKSTWTASYLQAAYNIPKTKYETVIRYSDLNSPHPDADQDQVALGVNYLFSANIIAKLSYELNNGLLNTATDSDRYMFQVSYGF